MNILSIKNLSYTYSIDTPFEMTAIKNINLDIKKGEIVGLIGHTGSGKSTLISLLNGLNKPTSGQVILDGHNIWDKEYDIRQARFKVGLVFQYPEYQLFEETVIKDISFGPINMGLDEEEVLKRSYEAMEFVGLNMDIAQKSPFELSGGQKRRVAIAGVIAMRPEVLILDEPTAGLDPIGRDEILNHIIKYGKSANATIILVTHSMEDIANVAQRIIVMNAGEVMLDGTPKNIFSKSRELEFAGLSVPVITRVFDKLYEKGLIAQHSIYTLEQGVDFFVKMKEGEKC